MSSRPNDPRPDFVLGLDLGQSQDFTALAILERTWLRSAQDKLVKHYAVRWLKRWPLKTSYPDIVAEVAQLVQTAPLDRPLLAIDETGVGVAIVQMFRTASVKAQLNPIHITGGHEIKNEYGCWHVPKKELVSTAQLLLQTQRIKFASMDETKLLVKELLSFKVKITISANETFEAWRERDHDDYVLAVAMAAWLGEEKGPVHYDYPEPIEPPRPNLWARASAIGRPGHVM